MKCVYLQSPKSKLTIIIEAIPFILVIACRKLKGASQDLRVMWPMKRSRCWDFINSNTLAKHRAQNANDADIATIQWNYRFEYFLSYFYDNTTPNTRFSRLGIYVGGLCATNLPRVILETKFSRVFPAFRETGCGTNEFERLPKRPVLLTRTMCR